MNTNRIQTIHTLLSQIIYLKLDVLLHQIILQELSRTIQDEYVMATLYKNVPLYLVLSTFVHLEKVL